MSPENAQPCAQTWKESNMKIKTKVRAGTITRCGGTRCGGTTTYRL